MWRDATYTFDHYDWGLLTLDGYDQLGYDGQNLCASMLQQIVNALPGEELVGKVQLTKTVEEERQVVVVVQLLNLHLCNREDIVIFSKWQILNWSSYSVVKLT